MSVDFVGPAREKFAFLEEAGFERSYLKISELGAEELQYKSEAVSASVWYGQGELSFAVCYKGGLSHGLGNILHASDPTALVKYRDWMSFTQAGVEEGLAQLADLVSRHAGPALRGDPDFFERLEKQGEANARQLELESKTSINRPKADAAFKRRDYAAAVKLYSEFQAGLTDAERKKLALAKERSKR